MRILYESYQDVQDYLKSPGLLVLIKDTLGEQFYEDPEEVCDFIRDEIFDQFQINVTIAYVTLYKVVGQELNFLDTERPVIEFNGYWYDFCAEEFNNSFDGQISDVNIPVTQKLIYAEDAITSRVSSIRGYALIGEFEEIESEDEEDIDDFDEEESEEGLYIEDEDSDEEFEY